jgi:uncharacterized membrane protein YbhN (UPF0104 family)
MSLFSLDRHRPSGRDGDRALRRGGEAQAAATRGAAQAGTQAAVGAGTGAAAGVAMETDTEAQLAGISTQSKRLRNGVIALAVFFGLIVALIVAVPGLSSVADRLSDANLAWVVVGIALELLSCLGYVILFELVFETDRRFSTRLSFAELAVNSVVSVSGAGGIALGAWVLRTKGVAVERIARRSIVMFLATSAVNVGAVVVIGVPMWLGLLSGSRNPLLTLLPAALALATILVTLALGTWAERLSTRHGDDRDAGGHARRRGRRVGAALAIVGHGVRDTVRLLLEHDWRLAGALGYWLFDTFVLYVCLAAYGPTPSFWAVAMAYLVGLFANSIPIPGGMVAVEGGVVGMLLLFHVRPAAAVVAAVVTYRAISLWLPALIGSLAFLSLRSEIGEPLLGKPQGALQR